MVAHAQDARAAHVKLHKPQGTHLPSRGSAMPVEDVMQFRLGRPRQPQVCTSLSVICAANAQQVYKSSIRTAGRKGCRTHLPK